jgi:hypothetical protein
MLSMKNKLCTNDMTLYKIEESHYLFLRDLKPDLFKPSTIFYCIAMTIMSIKAHFDLCTNQPAKNYKKAKAKFEDLNRQRSTLTMIYKKYSLESVQEKKE